MDDFHMSDNELPEPERGLAPFLMMGAIGLAGLFFVGVIASVLLYDPEETDAFTEEEIPPNVKQQPTLLTAADEFRVRFETTAGPFVVEVHPDWAPRGATQFRELVDAGFFEGNRFFRVVPDFVVQWGINGDPEVTEKWQQPIADDPPKHPNSRGTIVFAKSSLPHSRTTQLFINLSDNSGNLDPQGFAPFGEVIEGMENVEKIYSEYGERPQQPEIEKKGNSYLTENFPKLDSIKSAKIVE